jgi:hypothetical protein
MFRHLREDALAMLGGGTPAFMRLGHHAEAEQAASYIGRQYKFVLSQLTATVGGNHTFTHSDTEGYSDGTNSSRSWQEIPSRPRQQDPRNLYVAELVHRVVMGRRDQLE